MNIKTATKEEKRQWTELCLAKKKVRLAKREERLKDRKLSQRKWGKAREEEIREHLWRLGHTFDQQPKHIF